MEEMRPRRSLFAVWRWKWWVWCVIAPLLLVAYVASYPPAAYVFQVSEAARNRRVANFWTVAWSPLRYMAMTVSGVHSFLKWERGLLVKAFGDPVRCSPDPRPTFVPNPNN